MVRVYSTHCPKCNVLESKLKQKNIDFEECTDINEMMKKGIQTAPYLEVDSQLMDFGAAIRWVNGK